MKIRTRVKILGLALALFVLFAALPLQAQTSSVATISNLQYVGIESGNNHMILSWDAIPNESSAKLQIKGGGIADTWTSLDSNTTYTVNSTTYMLFEDLSSYRAVDRAFNFRVKVTLSDGNVTPWAYVDEDYP